MIESIVAIALGAALALIALPPFMSARARAEVSAARRAFSSAHALARQVAAQYGALGKLQVDPAGQRFWVTVDTSTIPGLSIEDTVGPVTIVDDRFNGVQISSSRKLLCFNPFGLGTARGGCELPNATVIFSSGQVADTLTISRLGRVRKR